MFGPFEKPNAVNPAITPGPASRFRSSLSDTMVRWEEHATFNPAAVVKDGAVYLLYRAEDASGAHMIGGHTSRIGLAESNDGLRLDRKSVVWERVEGLVGGGAIREQDVIRDR